MVHSSNKTFNIGKIGEEKLVGILKKHKVPFKPASIDEQQMGIDYIISPDYNPITVEVKTDEVAMKTGNIFYEVEVDGRKNTAWAYKCNSTIHIFFIGEEIIAVPTYKLVQYRERFINSYPSRITYSKSSSGKVFPVVGHLVPLPVLRTIGIVCEDTTDLVDMFRTAITLFS